MDRSFPQISLSRQTAARPAALRRGAVLLAGLSVLALSACDQTFDPDLRGYGAGGFSTANAAREASANRPAPDSRGVISYPNYQVAVAQQGDTVRSVAARVGVNADQLAQYNAVQADAPLGMGEVLALPNRVAEPTAVASIPTGAAGATDITRMASGAIDRASSGAAAGGAIASTTLSAPTSTPSAASPGPEPVRHRVQRGETAYTIARSYNVNVRSLADWNGLSGDMSVREGQYLLIPPAAAVAGTAVASNVTNAPGQPSAAPLPPSSSQPLPKEKTVPSSTPVATPTTNMGAQTTSASAARFVMPANGSIIRGYTKGKNDGIDIAAAAGSTVKAADAGTVAAITKDTDQVPILVIRHANNLLTVYANVDAVSVKKGDTVSRGQAIAKVRAGSSPFLHFEVRNGYDSADPMRYLQ